MRNREKKRCKKVEIIKKKQQESGKLRILRVKKSDNRKIQKFTVKAILLERNTYGLSCQAQSTKKQIK